RRSRPPRTARRAATSALRRASADDRKLRPRANFQFSFVVVEHGQPADLVKARSERADFPSVVDLPSAEIGESEWLLTLRVRLHVVGCTRGHHLREVALAGLREALE